MFRNIYLCSKSTNICAKMMQDNFRQVFTSEEGWGETDKGVRIYLRLWKREITSIYWKMLTSAWTGWDKRDVILCSIPSWIFYVSYEMFHNFFYKRKKSRVCKRWKTKQWQKAIPWTVYYLLLFSTGIYYKFAVWLIFVLRIWTKSFFFFQKQCQ